MIFVLCVRPHYSTMISTRKRRVLTKATVFEEMICAGFNASSYRSGTIIMGDSLLNESLFNEHSMFGGNCMNRKLISMVLMAGIMFSLAACNRAPGNYGTTASATSVTSTAAQALLTNEQALNAITNYLYKEYGQDKPSGDAPSYWYIDETQTNDETVVVDWRSYTAAHVYFYIDRATGETYVMESEPGKNEKVKKEEKFNAKDYLN